MSKSIAQDMEYRQSLMKYTEKCGVEQAQKACAQIGYNKQQKKGTAPQGNEGDGPPDRKAKAETGT